MAKLSYTVAEVARICQGELVAQAGSPGVVTDLLIDSRRLVHPEGLLFVALTSSRNDGHRYVGELYEKGVRSFMVRNPFPEPLEHFPEAAFIVVSDTLLALQRLAAGHRSRFGIPVVGITGSNGKTVVKEWLFQMLGRDYRIVRSPKSYNSQIGVPLSVWKIEPENDLALIEAGISEPGEMGRLEPIIRPTIGIFTNLGAAHDEQFASRREKAFEKLKLFARCKTLIYCADHPLIGELLREDSRYEGLSTFTWGRGEENPLRVTAVERHDGQTTVTVVTATGLTRFTIPFGDEASLENAMHCMAALVVLGYPPEAMNRMAGLLTPIAMRLELKEAINHCSLINDSYNSDLGSLAIALNFLNQQTRHSRRTVILSDILQTGREKAELYREIGEMLNRHGVSRLVGIGPDICLQSDSFPMEHNLFGTTDDFLTHFPFSTLRDEAILLKGARIFGFEKISAVLQQKAHETVMEVNLDAMVHNLNHVRSALAPGVRTMAMVKAFSYGSGSYEIAGMLQYHRVDYLAVAYADEGVELRRAGIHLPVMVMSPEEQSLDTLLTYNLEPEIYNLRILGQLEEAIGRGDASLQEEIRIHIKLDTGMHRLGFVPGDLPALTERLRQNPQLRVVSVFSHLAASEDPAEDAFTRQQIAAFEEMSNIITQSVEYPVLRHLLNSAGIARFPEAQFDMVRLGIGLYGVGATPEEQSKLRNVSTLRSVITQIKTLKKGETVGYNRKGVIEGERTIATVPIGYADGLNRRLGNGVGRLYIHGHPAPIIGNICMDLTMVDITEAIAPPPIGGGREGAVREGDPVIIFSDEHPVSELADLLGTIPYEVLTGISRRVKRIYYRE